MPTPTLHTYILSYKAGDNIYETVVTAPLCTSTRALRHQAERILATHLPKR